MKKMSIYIWMAMLVGLAIIFGACEGNTYIKPKTEELDISESQIVDFIEEGLSASTMGLQYDIQEATHLAVLYLKDSNMEQYCGIQVDSIIQYAYVSGLMGYEGSCNWTIQCNELSQPRAIDFVNHLLCDYKTTEIPRISSTTGLGNWNITPLPGSNLYFLTGQYMRDGYYKKGVEWDQSYYYQIEFSANQLKIDPNYTLSEKGVISFEGYIKDVTLTGIGASKNIEGTVELMENGDMLINLNGHQYIL